MNLLQFKSLLFLFLFTASQALNAQNLYEVVNECFSMTITQITDDRYEECYEVTVVPVGLSPGESVVVKDGIGGRHEITGPYTFTVCYGRETFNISVLIECYLQDRFGNIECLDGCIIVIDPV